MSSFDRNTRWQTLAPFIDGFIHDRLLQSIPHVDETLLQFGDVTNSPLVHPLLHRAPDFIVKRIQIWAVGWPQIRCDEFWSITLKKLKSVSCSVGGCTVLLTDNEIPGHFTDGRQQFLRQQHFSVHIDARIHKDEMSNTQL